MNVQLVMWRIASTKVGQGPIEFGSEKAESFEAETFEPPSNAAQVTQALIEEAESILWKQWNDDAAPSESAQEVK
jgi:hypothetical protein